MLHNKSIFNIWIALMIFALFLFFGFFYSKGGTEISHRIISSSGQCWVVEENSKTETFESLFTSAELDDCFVFLDNL